ncbi:HTH-type transcriptional regulator PuuR [Corynebacterium capitovis DSM 44611]|uniref:helix-turn-helix domain-containing protein n=1 Tax=Corynebacterium capitovis TaxID=131081 RepID=UPI0003A9359B|nr:XRE family transcriptional regulator [Corynebacterium capitovis]WKD58381.1 HTH-type transcriptional regulator PuuR [Corynebacterium capitovis DSM 44611]
MKSLPIEPIQAPPPIGKRLRALREQRRLTIDQVASFAGVTKGFLSRIERDQTSPSVGTLLNICQVLGVPAGSVLDSMPTQVVSLDSAPSVNLGGEGIREVLLTPAGQSKLQLIHTRVAPRGKGEDDLYTVDAVVEALHVLAGEFVLITPDQEIHLAAGDTATFLGTEPHSWFNPTDDEAVVLWIIAGQ